MQLVTRKFVQQPKENIVKLFSITLNLTCPEYRGSSTVPGFKNIYINVFNKPGGDTSLQSESHL